MINFRKPSNNQCYEKVLDFAREIDIWDIQRYYVYKEDLACQQLLNIYVEYQEQIIKIFIFTKSSTEWFIRM